MTVPFDDDRPAEATLKVGSPCSAPPGAFLGTPGVMV